MLHFLSIAGRSPTLLSVYRPRLRLGPVPAAPEQSRETSPQRAECLRLVELQSFRWPRLRLRPGACGARQQSSTVCIQPAVKAAELEKIVGKESTIITLITNLEVSYMNINT